MSVYIGADPANAAQVAHQTACNAAEAVRQQTDAASLATFVAGGTIATYTKAIHDADVTDYKARLASSVTNGVDSGPFNAALYVLRGTYF